MPNNLNWQFRFWHDAEPKVIKILAGKPPLVSYPIWPVVARQPSPIATAPMYSISAYQVLLKLSFQQSPRQSDMTSPH